MWLEETGKNPERDQYSRDYWSILESIDQPRKLWTLSMCERVYVW